MAGRAGWLSRLRAVSMDRWVRDLGLATSVDVVLAAVLSSADRAWWRACRREWCQALGRERRVR